MRANLTSDGHFVHSGFVYFVVVFFFTCLRVIQDKVRLGD